MAKYNGDDIIWRTIGGRRVPIRKGQSLSEAMKESGKFKKSKTEVKDKQKKFDDSQEKDKLIDNDMTSKELDETAQWLYDNDRDEWDKFTDNELKELAKKCQITKDNPGGRAYDDEVFEEMEKRGLSLNDSKKEMTSEELKNKYGTDNTDIINAGKESKDRVSLKEEKSIHTTSGDYNYDELKKRDETIKQLYKDTWNGKKSYKELNDELESLKKDGKVSQGELDALKYDASGETGDWKNNSKNANNSEYIGNNKARIKDRDDVVKQLDNEANNWKSEEGGVTRRETDKGTNYIQGTKKADGTSEYTRTDYDKNGNEISSKTYKSLDKAKNEDSDWRKQIESNNAQMEKDVTDLQNKINEYRTKSAQSNDALERYQYLKEADNLQNQYYERFRQNERANAKLKKESPNEKYEYVDTYATYKDKFNDTWGKDGSSDKVVSASMYTNDEFMEHLEDSNWHSERRQLLDANLTNQELKYIKDRTKVSAWGVENLTGKEQVSQLIKEAKDKYKSGSINDNIRRKAYQKYLKEHPNSKMKFEEFKDMRKQ